MTTRVEMIIETLKANKDKKLTARELAKLFIKNYPNALADKKTNPRYDTEQKLISQITAEIGGQRTVRAKAKCPNIMTRDKPRPRLYFWSDEITKIPEDTEETIIEPSDLLEHELYPLLISFLNEELGLYSLRIDEKTSSNNHGNGGNQWLHPDVVAIEPIDKSWDETVRTCVRHGNDKSVRLWSFEVKRNLTKGNVRKYFFQAVSNSSWSNFGYLVATSMADGVETELQMLSALHGIGVLLLDTEDLFNSQILIPSRERNDVDWLSANRIVKENKDFKHYVEQVGIYHQTGKLISSVWNK